MITRVAIVGSVGVPARYGGFETLAEALLLPEEDWLAEALWLAEGRAEGDRQTAEPAKEVAPASQGTQVPLVDAPRALLAVPAGHRVGLRELRGQ